MGGFSSRKINTGWTNSGNGNTGAFNAGREFELGLKSGLHSSSFQNAGDSSIPKAAWESQTRAQAEAAWATPASAALASSCSGKADAGNLGRMTATARTASPLRRGLYGMLAGGLLSATAAVVIALPAANADPQQQCNTTVGQTASQTVQSYLDRHPDVKQELAAKSQAEGGSNNVLDYLNRHPDVRQALITLANECTS
jgi:hypothetical protein